MRKAKLYEVARARLERTQFKSRSFSLSTRDQTTIREAVAIQNYFAVTLLGNDFLLSDLTHLQRRQPLEIEELTALLKKMRELGRNPKGPLPYPYNTISAVVKCYKAMLASVPSEALSAATATLFRRWNTAFSFLDKLTIQDGVWDDSEVISNLTKDVPINEKLLERLRDTISRYYDFDLGLFDPEFSHGATNVVPRGLGKGFKYWTAKHSTRSKTVINHLLSIGVDNWVDNDETLVGRIIAVPKSIDSKRLITMEPTMLTYCQQGLRIVLKHSLRYSSNPIKVFLEKQEISRDVAASSSFTKEFSTVDLSKASDSVRVKHVMCFPREIRKYLLLSRCPKLKYNNEIFSYTTFAGMGNATTFPVESIIFACITLIACEDAGCPPQGTVYGDDIIAPTKCVETLYKLLRAYGFTPNVQKSYTGSHPFREACGMEAHKGIDITPMRLPRKFTFEVQSPEQYDSAKDFHNRMFNYDPIVARGLLKQFPQLCQFKFGDTEVDLLSSGSFLNEDKEWRYNKNLQRYEEKYLEVATETSKTCDEVRYLMTLKALARTSRDQLLDPDDRIVVLGGPDHLKLTTRWGV